MIESHHTDVYAQEQNINFLVNLSNLEKNL